MSGILCSIILSVWIIKSQRILKDSFSVQGKGLCSYYLSGTLKPFFLQVSQCTVFPIQSCRRLYSFWRSLERSDIMWVIVSSLALHIQHLGSFLVPSMFVLMLLVFMHWPWPLVISDSVSLFKWPFSNQFHGFMSAIFSVSLMNWPWILLFFQSCFLLISLLLSLLLLLLLLLSWRFI